MKIRYVIGGLAVGAVVGVYAARRLKREQYGAEAPGRFRRDDIAAHSFNENWAEEILEAHAAGKPLLEIGSYRIRGPQATQSDSFKEACRLYEAALQAAPA